MAQGFPVIHVQAAGASPTELMVFGERNSGTNLAHALLQRNFAVFKDAPGDRIGRFGFRYGWKHGFPTMLAAPDHVLSIGLFRHPETWLRSMHARPWHAAPSLKNLPFEAFIRTQWCAIVDEMNFGLEPNDARALQELHWDRHPMSGERFENILALRTAKSAAFLTLPKRFANCLLIRHEEVTSDPEAFVSYVAGTYGLERNAGFQPVTERRGKASDGTFRSKSYPPLSHQDRAFVWANLDEHQERRLGYAPLSS